MEWRIVACKFNCLSKMKDFSILTDSHVHRTSCNVSETVRDTRRCYYRALQ